MTLAYKFLQTAYLDQVLSQGKLRIASLAYYRALESKQWIADVDEGRVSVTYREEVDANELERITPRFAIPTVSAGRGNQIILSNRIHEFDTPDVFVFCASVGDLEALTGTMCRDADHPYDSCFSFDANHLAHRLRNRGRVLELDAARVGTIFAWVECGLVTYGNVERDQAEGKPPPMAFLKAPRFVSQNEIRIALYPYRNVGTETLTIEIPKPHSVFREEFRNLSF